jgi:hypothetical protein
MSGALPLLPCIPSWHTQGQIKPYLYANIMLAGTAEYMNTTFKSNIEILFPNPQHCVITP